MVPMHFWAFPAECSCYGQGVNGGHAMRTKMTFVSQFLSAAEVRTLADDYVEALLRL